MRRVVGSSQEHNQDWNGFEDPSIQHQPCMLRTMKSAVQTRQITQYSVIISRDIYLSKVPTDLSLHFIHMGQTARNFVNIANNCELL